MTAYSIRGGFITEKQWHRRLAGVGKCPAVLRLQVLCPIAALGCIIVAGCGRSGPATKVVYGTVTCGDEKVETGMVRFVPIDGTPGPASMSRITDGEYRIEARGGVPLGRHRIEVDARRKVADEMPVPEGAELWGFVDLTVRLGAEEYAGNRSPLIIEVTAGSDGRIDIEVPRP